MGVEELEIRSQGSNPKSKIPIEIQETQINGECPAAEIEEEEVL